MLILKTIVVKEAKDTWNLVTTEIYTKGPFTSLFYNIPAMLYKIMKNAALVVLILWMESMPLTAFILAVMAHFST